MGRTWIDVGAHLGEKTFAEAERDPSLRVYAFEPNLPVATRMMGRLPNYVVIPMAIAEADGAADFYVNSFAAASSLLPFDPEGLRRWVGGDQLHVDEKITVAAIRLDRFMHLVGIEDVEFLKIDAQGADLAVVRSAGVRLRDIARVAFEVQITERELYAGGARRDDAVRYMREHGFVLEAAERQSFNQEENLTFVRQTV